MDKPKQPDFVPGAGENGMPIVLTPEQAKARAQQFREEEALADVEDDFDPEDVEAIINGSDDDE